MKLIAYPIWWVMNQACARTGHDWLRCYNGSGPFRGPLGALFFWAYAHA